jgi:tetratricopeptide (TPR) repeat protein
MAIGLFRRLASAAAISSILLVGTACQDVHARKLVKEGNDLYRAGEFKGAITRYDEAEKLKPDLKQIYINRAYAYLMQFAPGSNTPESNKAAEGAMASYSKFLELEPNRKDVRDLLIQLQLDSAHYDEALAYFKRVLDKDPKNLEAVKTIGIINSKAGRFDEALSWYQKRAELEQSNPEGWYAVGTLCWERLHTHAEITGPDRLAMADKGIDALATALKLNDKYAEAYTYTNLLYRERAIGHGDVNDPKAGQAAADAGQADLKKADENLKKALELLRSAKASSTK